MNDMPKYRIADPSQCYFLHVYQHRVELWRHDVMLGEAAIDRDQSPPCSFKLYLPFTRTMLDGFVVEATTEDPNTIQGMLDTLNSYIHLQAARFREER